MCSIAEYFYKLCRILTSPNVYKSEQITPNTGVEWLIIMEGMR